ncbi:MULTISPECIES: hypothetical protein [unclassified Mesorhizobium]|uniref:hypothetical protein n=1 Tax=unclassified Mesorhizobium TaxID=325217 RepID=UPI0011262FE3|nr:MULTISPECIES: hypothetical protein [unclassified Mesorhizobium]TPJ86981.1 hypothetical protein FJ489_31015 [Mesorhizobium sp. B2-5-12]TPK19204.1 hypothetical protein FJ562_31420 [Mesorhizobium sp. B2-5-6]
MDDGWIEWRGGECPVDGDVTVEVRFQNMRHEEGEPTTIEMAGAMWWDHREYGGVDSPGNILAYRIHKES